MKKKVNSLVHVLACIAKLICVDYREGTAEHRHAQWPGHVFAALCHWVRVRDPRLPWPCTTVHFLYSYSLTLLCQPVFLHSTHSSYIFSVVCVWCVKKSSAWRKKIDIDPAIFILYFYTASNKSWKYKYSTVWTKHAKTKPTTWCKPASKLTTMDLVVVWKMLF